MKIKIPIARHYLTCTAVVVMAFFAGFAALAIDPFFPSFGNNGIDVQHYDLQIAIGDDPDGFKADMEAIYAKLLVKHVGSAVVDTPLDLFSDRTYRRGALALYAVELQIGTRKLTHLLKRWVTQYCYQSVDSQDFIELAVRDSGDDAVRAILEAWLYDDAMPALPGLDPDESALNTAARSALVRASASINIPMSLNIMKNADTLQMPPQLPCSENQGSNGCVP